MSEMNTNPEASGSPASDGPVGEGPTGEGAAGEAVWYYARNGQQVGPVSFAQMRTLVTQGQVVATDLVWEEGSPQWVPANQSRLFHRSNVAARHDAAQQAGNVVGGAMTGGAAAEGQPMHRMNVAARHQAAKAQDAARMQTPLPDGSMPRPKKGFPVWGILLIVFGSIGLIVAVLAAVLMPALSGARERARYIKWAGYSHSLRADPSMYFYFNFEQQGPGNKDLWNRSAGNVMMMARHDVEPEDMNGQFPDNADAQPQWSAASARFKGKFGLRFDGQNDHLTVPFGFQKELGAFSIHLWVKPDDVGSGKLQRLITLESEGEQRLVLALKGDLVHAQSDDQSIEGVVSLDPGKFNLIVWTLSQDAEEQALYVNGTKAGQALAPSELALKNAVWRIGCDADGEECFAGMIDELGVFNVAIDGTQIDEIFRVGQPQ